MATHKSAEKRDRQDVKRLARNRAVKASVKTAIKAARETISVKNGDATVISASLAKVIPVIAKAAAKGTIHKNTAARKISRLTKLANTAKG